jgi:MFS family permease
VGEAKSAEPDCRRGQTLTGPAPLHGLSNGGYATSAIAQSWPFVFVGWLGAFPLTFAVIADSLPRERRVIAFSVRSILVRVPRVIGAPIGGLLIPSLGIIAGIRAALLVTLLVALGVLAVQRYGCREDHDVASQLGGFAKTPPRQHNSFPGNDRATFVPLSS